MVVALPFGPAIGTSLVIIGIGSLAGLAVHLWRDASRGGEWPSATTLPAWLS